MSRTVEVRKAVVALVPAMPGWKVYEDVATGQSPPWIVVRVSETGRSGAEDLHAVSHDGVLDIRVVGRKGDGISIAMDRLKDSLDGATPADRRISRLIPDQDSGLYAAELTDTKTSAPFLMRVLTWRFAWTG